MHSKLAKRVLGAMISAAVMVSMIPAMALADGKDGTTTVTFTFSNSPVRSGDTRTSNGIILAPVGGQVGNNSYFGVDEYGEGADPDPEDDIVGEGTFTFSIDPSGAYAGGEITSIVIGNVRNITNMAFVSGTDNGWSDFQTGSLTWAPKTEGASFGAVSLTLDATRGQGHYFNYGSITITVRVPVDSITVAPAESEELYMYSDSTDYMIVATVSPNTTLYDDAYMTWASSDEEAAVLTIDEIAENVITVDGKGPGTATITASLGGVDGTYDVTVYDHVAGVTISDTEEELNVGYTMGLEAYPTNKSDVRAEDWTVEFTSSDPEIASVTVVDGIAQITALEAGNVTITATLTDKSQPIVEGDTPYKTYTATCAITVTEVDTVIIYRMYNTATSEHLYTANVGERDSLINNGWRYEGPAWIAPSISNTPVIRLYNPNAEGGDHVYSSNEGEIATLEAAGWRNEGTAFYSDDFERMTVYRVYDSGSTERNHHYSVDQGEIDWLVGLGYTNEGPALYGIGLYNEAT